MAVRVNKKRKIALRRKFEDVATACADALVAQWQLKKTYGYWVADDIGGVYCYGDYIFINLYEMLYCLEFGISEEEFVEWQEYCIWAKEFRQNVPNLKAWHNGCPRCSRENQQRLIKMKQDMELAMEMEEFEGY